MNDLRLNNHVTLMNRSESPSFNQSNKPSTSAQSMSKIFTSNLTNTTNNTTNNNPFSSTNISNRFELPIDTNKKKKNQFELPSIRFEVKLNKPSAEKFSEFNYNKLILKSLKTAKKLNKKSKKESKENNSQEQLDNNFLTITQNDLPIVNGEFKIEKKRIKDLLSAFNKKILLSKELEELEEGEETNEYDDYEDDEFTNESIVEKKGKKKSKQTFDDFDFKKFAYKDFSYLGKGYDENDSFIDNSDARDVHIPKNMAPKKGGFYINKKKLELKKVDEIKKLYKKSKETDENATEDDLEDNDNYDESEDYSESDDEDESEDESTEDGSDENDEESEDETDIEDESEDKSEKTIVNKNIPEIDLASSNSSSCKLRTENASSKKSKKRLIVDDDDNEIEELNQDENEIKYNKENNINNNQNDQSLVINNKKRKNDTISNEINIVNSIEQTKIQTKVMSNSDNISQEEIHNLTYKKKKIESNNIEQSILNRPNNANQILNEKNQLSQNKINLVQQPQQQLINENIKDHLINKPVLKEESNEYIDVEDNSDQNQNKSNSIINNSLNNINRSNLVNQQATLQNTTLPENLSNEFKATINKLIDLYKEKVNSPVEPLTPDLKNILLKIYSESKRIKLQSQIFNFISFKTNRNKESLFRICRRMLNKETLSQSLTNAPQQIKQETGLNSSVNLQNNQILNNVPKTPQNSNTISNNTSLKLKNASPLSSPQITLADLNEDIRNKLSLLKNEYLIAKQKMEVSNFFNNQKIISLIYSIDCSLKSNRNWPRLREYCVSVLSEAFELNRDQFFRKYTCIINQIRLKNLENSLRNKMNELKKEIDLEMPKNLEKFSKQMEEFNKNKKILESMSNQDPESKKKLNPPRKRFELNEKIKELIVNTIHFKMSIYKLNQASSPSPQNQTDSNMRLNYIDNFFENELINLWPKNWMQKNVLINIYQIKYCQQQQLNQQHQQQQQKSNQQNQSLNQTQNLNKTTSTPISTTSSTLNQIQQVKQSTPIINISSKNGKQIKIEPTASSSLLSSSTPFSSQPTQSQTPVNKSNITQSQSIQNHNMNKQNLNQQQSIQKSQTINQHQHPNSSQILIGTPKQNVYDSVVKQFSQNQNINSNISSNKTNLISTPKISQQINSSFNSSLNIEDLFQNNTVQKQSSNTQLNKSPHNLYQISNLISNVTNSNSQTDLAKLQQLQQLNFMLPNLLNSTQRLNSPQQNHNNRQNE